MKNYLIVAATALTLLGGFSAPSFAQVSPPGPGGGSFRGDAVPPPAAERMRPPPPRHAVRHHRPHRQHVVNNDAGHVERCKARFRSYSERTDTYIGFDHKRHPCRL